MAWRTNFSGDKRECGQTDDMPLCAEAYRGDPGLQPRQIKGKNVASLHSGGLRGTGLKSSQVAFSSALLGCSFSVTGEGLGTGSPG